MLYPDELTRTFRSEYSRLCILTAKALKQGHNAEQVTAASRGKGSKIAPVYAILRTQHQRTHMAAEFCTTAGITLDELVVIAGDVRTVVESEWMLTIPALAEDA